MPLTIAAVRNAKPAARPYKLADGDGMYLEIAPGGGKWWRLKYRFGGRERRLSLGTFPEVTLAEARDRRHEMRRQLAQGIDPGEHRKTLRIAEAESAGLNSFESITREWYLKFSPGWAPTHSSKIIRRLEQNIFPELGHVHVAQIEAPALLAALRKIEARGRLETAHRTLQVCGQVFRYAIATGRASRDPSGDLRGALAPWKPQHYASITDPREIGALLRAIDSFTGTYPTLCALRLAPLVFVRPGELRCAEWSEFDLEAAEWRIPANKMKARVQHLVPLSRQALEILRSLEPLTGRGRLLFPGLRSEDQPMSENTISAALRRLGYARDEMTAHGFRSMASTRLNEMGWHRDAIERQLAHGERDSVRAAYNYAEHLPERRRMMQAWADCLDRLRVGGSRTARPGKARRGK